jgi:hypothetical protein
MAIHSFLCQARQYEPELNENGAPRPFLNHMATQLNKLSFQKYVEYKVCSIEAMEKEIQENKAFYVNGGGTSDVREHRDEWLQHARTICEIVDQTIRDQDNLFQHSAESGSQTAPEKESYSSSFMEEFMNS